MKPIYNTNIPEYLWTMRFTREQLRNIAREYGVNRGQNKRDTAFNLAHGLGLNHNVVRFELALFNPVKRKQG